MNFVWFAGQTKSKPSSNMNSRGTRRVIQSSSLHSLEHSLLLRNSNKAHGYHCRHDRCNSFVSVKEISDRSILVCKF
jgi:hypothetical protein